MNRRKLGALFLISGMLLPASAWADEVLERVVVRNRLYDMAGRLELAPDVGFSLVDRLTSTVTVGGGAAINVADWLGFEVRAAYGITRHTGLADRISAKFLTRDPAQGIQRVDDLANLWEMKWNLMAGFRWSPIYGKLSLLSEVPVHFQAYAWLGGGMGGFHRESVVYCLAVASREDGTCSNWLTDDRVSPVGSGAVGLRFFTGQKGSIKIELRDFVYSDSYRVDIDRVAAESGDRTSGTPASSPGLTHVMVLDVGYAFIF